MDGWGLGVILLAGENQEYVSSTGRLCLIDASWETCVCVGGTTSDRLGTS